MSEAFRSVTSEGATPSISVTVYSAGDAGVSAQGGCGARGRAWGLWESVLRKALLTDSKAGLYAACTEQDMETGSVKIT